MGRIGTAHARGTAVRVAAAAARRVKRILLRFVVEPTHRLEEEFAARPDVVHAGPRSPRRIEIVARSIEVEGFHRPIPGFPRSLPYVLSSARGIRTSLREVADNPNRPRTSMSTADRHRLEAEMRAAGVDLFGYARVAPDSVFEGKAVLHANVIVLAMEMDRDRLDTAPSPEAAVMVMETYDGLGRAANRIARYLRRHGFSAQAGHPLEGPALYPPLAQAAGLGWLGLHGLLITPAYGPRVRLAAVFTSIEDLPETATDEHTWIEDFCRECAKCVRRCPPRAIREQPVPHAGGRMSAVDADRCLPYFVRHDGCSICIAVCPFHQRDYHRLKQRWIRHREHAARLREHPPGNFPQHLRLPPVT